MKLDKNNIKAVTFDLWETLLLEKNGWNQKRMNIRCQKLAQALNKLGTKIQAKQLAFAFKEMTTWLETIWDNNNEVTHIDQIQFIIQTTSKGALNLKKEWINQLSTAYVSAIFEIPPVINPDTHKVLQWLKNQNKRIGIICNTGLTPGIGIRKFLAQEGIANYFDATVFSDEVGIRKPNPKIFQIAAQKLQTKPNNIVHVGDNLKSDIWGAQNAGFKTIFLATETGRDRIAESDPKSLVAISRKLGNLKKEEIVPDKMITSLAATITAIQELEK
ncbi:HAD-IA family hydrolase [Candidatus Bathyarchaeota archaeon]|nr:HAD-IA family hydrolase [Candidatus Bathyarchaeota archaeon]